MKGFVKPRLYSDVNLSKPDSELDHSSVLISWGKQENYEILRKLGRGKYSDVYEGIDVTTSNKVVLKVLKPIKKSKVLREIQVLRALEGCNGVPRILDIVKENNTKTPSLVLSHTDSGDVLQLFNKLEEFDVKYYFYEMLKILDFAHSRGVFHRDIKPSNVLIDHNKRLLRIIDWGLADFYVPERSYNVRVASRYYKSPELLVNYSYYDYSVDMWAYGSILAGVIFKKIPFFHGHDNYDQLIKIVRTLGSVGFFEYLEKYDVSLDERFEELKVHYNPKNLSRMAHGNPLATNEAIDLVSKILVYDPSQRLLPAEAMQHEYFTEVREMWAKFESGTGSGEGTLGVLLANKNR